MRSACAVRQTLKLPRVPDEELPERGGAPRLQAATGVPLMGRYRRFMMERASDQRRARLAGDSAREAELAGLGLRLVSAFNRWRDGQDLGEDDRRLLEEHLGNVPAGR